MNNNHQTRTTNLQMILDNGELSPSQLKAIEQAGWWTWNNSYDYTDLETDVTYQSKNENGIDDYSLNIHFTFNWFDKISYMTVGINKGSGYDSFHETRNDGRNLETQIADLISNIEKENKDDPFVNLIKKHSDEWSDLLNKAKSLSFLINGK